MPKKLTVSNQYGTFSRTTNKPYTHLVISTGERVEVFMRQATYAREYLERVMAHLADPETVTDERGIVWKYKYTADGKIRSGNGYHPVKDVARFKRNIKQADARLEAKRRGVYLALSWHSREDLAQRAANDWRSRGYEDVRVIPVESPARGSRPLTCAKCESAMELDPETRALFCPNCPSAQAKIQTVIVCDLAGNGFAIMWTLDGETWVNVSHKPLNRAEAEGYMARYRAENPEAEVRQIEDFYCRIPEDLVREKTRVI